MNKLFRSAQKKICIGPLSLGGGEEFPKKVLLMWQQTTNIFCARNSMKYQDLHRNIMYGGGRLISKKGFCLNLH